MTPVGARSESEAASLKDDPLFSGAPGIGGGFIEGLLVHPEDNLEPAIAKNCYCGCGVAAVSTDGAGAATGLMASMLSMRCRCCAP